MIKIFIALIFGFLGKSFAFEILSSDFEKTYYAYDVKNNKNCMEGYEKQPFFVVTVNVLMPRREIFLKYYDLKTREKHIEKLGDCEIMDKKNWVCGDGINVSKNQMVDGFYTHQFPAKLNMCNIKYIPK